MKKALFGNIVYAISRTELVIKDNHYVISQEGKVTGVYEELPKGFDGKVYDFKDKLIIPGLCDTHLHAPQYSFRGTGMDYELIRWLNNLTFPEESKYEDLDYAKKSYEIFVEDLKFSATTRAAIFATTHVESTFILMKLLEKTGLKCLVGKVNMDRNCPDSLAENGLNEALINTENWIIRALTDFKNVKPIITPRFIPSCSDELLQGLGNLATKYALNVQSHLSENLNEIAWVKELCPWAQSYSMAYDRFNLFGNVTPTVMAHCVHCDEFEQEHIKKNRVLVAHCPSSNANLASGIAPIKTYLNKGIDVSLGTDIGAGYDISIFRAMADAVQMSKIRSSFSHGKEKPLTITEVFFMGTKGASSLFGKVGSFEEGYEFDAVVVDDAKLKTNCILNTKERLERAIYLEKTITLAAKFVSGEQIF